MSNIGSISYVNQNQVVAIDNQAKLHAKLLAEGEILPDRPEVAVIEESSESAKTNTNLDEEKNYSEEEHARKEKEKQGKKRYEFFGVVLEEDVSEEEIKSDRIFDKLV